MRRRQIGLRARNKLAQLSPNSRGILANVARLPASSNFSSLAFFSLFLSISLPPSLSPSPSFTLHLAITFSSSLDARTNTLVWKNHESVSLNPILTELETAQPWKRKRFVHAPRRLPEKELLETREKDSTWRSLCVHRGDWSSVLNIPWLLTVSLYAFLFSFFFLFFRFEMWDFYVIRIGMWSRIRNGEFWFFFFSSR